MKRYRFIFVFLLIPYFTGLLPIYGLPIDISSAVQIPILMYHDFQPAGGGYSVTPDKFRRDLQALRDDGYTTIFYSEMLDYTENGAPLPEKPVILTFDDGYVSNYTTAFPILKEFGMKAEIAVICANIANMEIVFDWEQAREMEASGLVHINCHSYRMHEYSPDGKVSRVGVLRNNGENFTNWEHLFRQDLAKAEELFLRELGRKPDVFTYPNGAFSAEAERILRETGYRVTVTTTNGVNSIQRGDGEAPYLLLRLGMDWFNGTPLDLVEQFQETYSSADIQAAKQAQQVHYATRRDAFAIVFSNIGAVQSEDETVLSSFRDAASLTSEERKQFAFGLQNNILSGYDDQTLRPDGYITRGELAVIIARSGGYFKQSDDPAADLPQYPDLSDWNRQEVFYCMENGYMMGYRDRFGADAFVTPEELAGIGRRLEQVRIN